MDFRINSLHLFGSHHALRLSNMFRTKKELSIEITAKQSLLRPKSLSALKNWLDDKIVSLLPILQIQKLQTFTKKLLHHGSHH